MHHHSVFWIHPSHSLYNKHIFAIPSLSPSLCAHRMSPQFNLFCNNFHKNNSNPNAVIESVSAIIISDVRGDSSWVFAMHLRILQDCQLMSAHWLILHSTHSGEKKKKKDTQVNCCIHFLCKMKTLLQQLAQGDALKRREKVPRV